MFKMKKRVFTFKCENSRIFILANNTRKTKLDKHTNNYVKYK